MSSLARSARGALRIVKTVMKLQMETEANDWLAIQFSIFEISGFCRSERSVKF